MKRLFLLCLLIAVTATAFAQRVTVSGRVVEEDGTTPIEQATVQILSLPDSAYVNGCVTDPNGNFTLPAVKAGKYVVKVSFVGYNTQMKSITLVSSRTKENIGTCFLPQDGVLLGEAVVVAQAAQVEVKEDTIQYNASAYRVPEGSALEELVKKIPGAEVSEDGKITLNGKDISKIMVNGKEFFSGDTDMALKNITVDMIENLKAYDRKSDLARITGIDDGEEEAVLDLTMKQGQNQGTFANMDLGYGTKKRYTTRGMLNRFSDNYQVSIMGNANNTNDMGFPGGGGGFRGGNNNGLRANKRIGGNFAYENKYIETGGNIQYNHNSTDVQSLGSNHNFQSNQYGNSRSMQFGSSTNFNFDYRLEWKPDSMNNIIFRPRANYRKNSNDRNSLSTSSNSDPSEAGSLLSIIQEFLAEGNHSVFDALNDQQKLILLNAQRQETLSKSSSTEISGELQFNHKFSSNGRNLTFRVTGGFSDGKSESFTNSDQWFFQSGFDDTVTRRFTNTPTKNSNFSGRVTYSEPIAKAVYLQFSYMFTHRFSKSDKQVYDLGDLLNSADAIGMLPINYSQNQDKDQSKYVENVFDNHDIAVTLRVIRPKWQLNAGVNYKPQYSKTSYQQGANMDHLDVFSRSYNNVSPTIDYRYNFNKQTRLRIEWRNNASQPSVSNLVPAIDTSNPLTISAGNPELKPSYTNNVSLQFNTFIPSSQTTIVSRFNVRATSNNVSNMQVYRENGGTYSMPKNTDGNWNMFGMFVFNTALKDKRFNIGTFTNVMLNNMSSFFNNGQKVTLDTNNFQNFYNAFNQLEAIKNITKSLVINERLSFNFRSDWFDVGVNGGLQYQKSDNKLDASKNTNTYNFSYGLNGNLRFPWNMSISTDLTNNSRRGYSEPTFNTNELLWNVQISQSFLRGKAATLTLQFFDILGQQSTVSRSISANMQSDTEYNAIHKYAMLKFTYRLNLMGSRDARAGRGRDGWGGFPGGGFPGGGRPGGGFGRPF
ncbi:MAG: TonB-dependent receptor [Bacteroidales bacterium]|nr:TonB-dependent receptor [Candidatus Minthousia equi]